MSRVFVMGLDGATMDIMMPMIQRGELPTFKKIVKNGGYGKLRSVVPPLSPPAWVSFATGKNPGKNGILGFTKMAPNSYRLRLVSGRDNRSRTIWEISSQADKKVIVLNVPMTYPPAPVNGLLVSGLDTPDMHSDFTHPPELKEELLARFPDYTINLQLGGYLQTDRRRRSALRSILNSIESRYRVALYLMEKYPWDLFVVKFNNPDIVQHHFWKYMDPNHPEYETRGDPDFRQAIAQVYGKLDEIAASFMRKLDDETIFMAMSDHGAGPRINKVVYVNGWLRHHGYLCELARQVSGGSQGLSRDLAPLLNGLLSFLFRNTAPGVRRFLKNLMPGAFSRLSLAFKFSSWLSDIDWSKTSVFMAEEGYLRVNLKGVYPKGFVEERDYFRLRQEIVQRLKRLDDPETGEPVFEDVLAKEEAFGPCDGKGLPDIQLVTRDAKYDISGKLLKGHGSGSDPFVRKERHGRGPNGMHRPDGILLLKGPHFRPAEELKDLDLIDLFPTILFLLGVAIPKDIDGRVIEEAFHPDFLKNRPIQYVEYQEQADAESGEVYSEDDASKILDHLKSLGYLE